MELECGKMVLRSISDRDTGDILRWRNSENVRKYFIDQRLLREEDHRKWLRTKVDTQEVVQFIILLKEGRHPIGTAYLQNIDRQHKKAEYGIFIGEGQMTGRGIGTVVTERMIRFAFEECGLHKLYLRVYEDNRRAIASYEKAGFLKEALLKEDVFVNGGYKNIILMGIVKAGI